MEEGWIHHDNSVSLLPQVCLATHVSMLFDIVSIDELVAAWGLAWAALGLTAPAVRGQACCPPLVWVRAKDLYYNDRRVRYYNYFTSPGLFLLGVCTAEPLQRNVCGSVRLRKHCLSASYLICKSVNRGAKDPHDSTVTWKTASMGSLGFLSQNSKPVNVFVCVY